MGHVLARASECLCEEALRADGSFDPYRVQMTPAMSQEAYFTSFVEGAEYPLEEAVAFLRRGTDPENMYEQNILNNHQAWSYMLGALNIPFDEQFVKDLAFCLTEGQNDGSIDYRQEDSAEIPAMDGESYEVPSAFSLPERMAQLSQFLSDNNVHPLIKAAVAHAWIFAVRPFPEANERLARMISSAVLLRCGYDYFLDISISANIAHENYRYIKAIRETIRSENDGDMTYFIEYYIELLARTLNAHKESLQQEALEAERQMAMQPLAPSPPVNVPKGGQHPYPHCRADAPTESQEKPEESRIDSGDAYNNDAEVEALIRGAVPINAPEPVSQEVSQLKPSQAQPRAPENDAALRSAATDENRKALVQTPQDMSSYAALLAEIAPFALIEGFSEKMCAILKMGLFRFTSLEWSEVNLVDNDQALEECKILFYMNRAIQEGQTLSFGVGVFDLNDLKKINDVCGHVAGDSYIREGCQLICDCFQHSPVYRIGGDEFAVILERTDFEKRESLMAEFDRQMEENRRQGSMVVSGGIATFEPGRDSGVQSVFERADARMYERKKQLKAISPASEK